MTSNLRWHLCSKDDFPFKRHKVQKACQTCRLKKMRCDGRLPCLRCETQHIECVYDQNKGPTRTQPQAEHSPDMTIKKDVSNGDVRFDLRGLRRISFTNTLYDSMRHTNDGSRGYLFQTHLPPLMFDFFNLTSQPHSIWSRFTSLFRQHTRRPTKKAAVDLGTEILRLFDDHNWLYASFIDIQPLTDAWSAAPVFHVNPTPTSINGSTSSSAQHVLLYAIFALVCHAAFQSLSATHTDIARDLEQYSASFYHEAHHRFLQSVFTSQQKMNDRAAELTRATILLAHYQCAALCENQAYITLKMGSGFLTFIKDPTSAPEKERLRALSSVLNAWITWIVFYLHLSEPISTAYEEASSTETMMPSPTSSVLASDRTESQQWAANVVDAYTRFLTRLRACRGTQTLSHVQALLESLEIWHNMSLSNSNQKTQTDLPMQILALYHHVLVIHVIFSQIPAAALMFGSPLEEDSQVHQDVSDIETMVFEKCDKEAADIVHRIDSLILNYHVPLGDLETVQRRYPIAHNVLYPLCLATSITRIYMKRHPKLAAHTRTNIDMATSTNDVSFARQIKEKVTQGKVDSITSKRSNGSRSNPKSVTVMPIYKLKRVLNPICSLMDAANVISTPVDEIMMASITTSNVFQQPQQQGRHIPDNQPSSERYLWPENGSMFEESLVPLQSRMMTYPSSYDYRSRNNIDKEQLEKLSQNKDLRSNSTTGVTATASNSAPIPMSRTNSIAKVHRSMLLSRSRSVSAPSTAHNAHPVRKRGGSHASPQQHLAAQGVKRHYQSNNLNVFANDPNFEVKRVRTDSAAYGSNNGFDDHLLRPSHPVQIQRRTSPFHGDNNVTPHHHHHATQTVTTMQQQPHPQDLDSEHQQQAAALQQMYQSDFFFMMHPDSAAAAAAVAGGEELYFQQRRGMKAAAAVAVAAAAGQMQSVAGPDEEDGTQQQPQQQPQAQPSASTPTPSSVAASIAVTTSSSAGGAGTAATRIGSSFQNDTMPAKLLPPPKQQRTLPLKGGYSGVSYPTTTPVDFSESVMETLHHAHSVEPSFAPTGMVDPSMNLNMTTTAAAAAVAAARQNQQQQQQQQQENQHQTPGGNSGEIMYLFGDDSRGPSQQHPQQHQQHQQQDWMEQQTQPPQQRSDKGHRHSRSSWYGRQAQQAPPVSTSPTAWANFAQLYQDPRHYGNHPARSTHNNVSGGTGAAAAAAAAATTANSTAVVNESFEQDQWIMPDTAKMAEESVMNWH